MKTDFDGPDRDVMEMVEQRDLDIDDLAKLAIGSALDNGYDMHNTDPEEHAQVAYEGHAFNFAEWVFEDSNEVHGDTDWIEYDLPELRTKIATRIEEAYLEADEG